MHSRRYRILWNLRGPIRAVVALAAVSTAEAQESPRRPRLETLRPAVDLRWVSGPPDARGDGASFSGPGANLRMSAGLQGMLGGLRFRLVPELIHNANGDHQTFASGDPARSPFASPFYHGAFSADLPSRPGASAYSTVWFGESAVWWSSRRAFIGALTTTPRWGPASIVHDSAGHGVRGEGFVFGRSAPGLPRMEVAVAWPRAGGLTRVRWFGGVAQESRWFDADRANDRRGVAGLRVEYERPGSLAMGASRTVMTTGGTPFADALLRPLGNARPGSGMELLAGDVVYAHPAGGTTLWLEGARQAPVRSMGAWLRAPGEGLALRAGVSQRVARTKTAAWVATLEFARLDQAGTRDDVVPNDLYTSAVVIQGWTHLGQPLGSGLGPGGQRQLASLERSSRTWRLAGFVERARWNDDAMLRQPSAAMDRHDLTLQAGLSAARRVASHDATVSLTAGRRYNYLFQGPSTNPGNQAVDLSVLRLGVTLTPRTRVPRIVGVFPEP